MTDDIEARHTQKLLLAAGLLAGLSDSAIFDLFAMPGTIEFSSTDEYGTRLLQIGTMNSVTLGFATYEAGERHITPEAHDFFKERGFKYEKPAGGKPMFVRTGQIGNCKKCFAIHMHVGYCKVCEYCLTCCECEEVERESE